MLLYSEWNKWIFETLFPLELLNHAFYVTCIGGEMNYDKMNFLYRRLFQSLKK